MVREIIGLVPDTRDTVLDDTPVPMVFLPHQQHPTGAMTHVVRAGGDPGSIVSAVKAAVWTVASVGMFRVIKYLVERRTRELGLRMALGAAPYRPVRALIGEGLRLAATGVLVGVVGAPGLDASGLKTDAGVAEPVVPSKCQQIAEDIRQ